MSILAEFWVLCGSALENFRHFHHRINLAFLERLPAGRNVDFSQSNFAGSEA
jgi:hypothetical protein